MLFICSKDKFIDIFQGRLSDIEIELKYLMKALKADRRGEFISIKFKVYC